MLRKTVEEVEPLDFSATYPNPNFLLTNWSVLRTGHVKVSSLCKCLDIISPLCCYWQPLDLDRGEILLGFWTKNNQLKRIHVVFLYVSFTGGQNTVSTWGDNWKKRLAMIQGYSINWKLFTFSRHTDEGLFSLCISIISFLWLANTCSPTKDLKGHFKTHLDLC